MNRTIWDAVTRGYLFLVALKKCESTIYAPDVVRIVSPKKSSQTFLVASGDFGKRRLAASDPYATRPRRG